MWIEELIAKCPRFSKVLLYVRTGRSEAYRYADPGDVLHLLEYRGEKVTGRSIVALVLRGSEDRAHAPKSEVRLRVDQPPHE
jgi:hypothetical protein